MKELGIIYKAENKINGRVYVGQTSKELSKRISQHKRDCLSKKENGEFRSSSPFHYALRKYGIKSFEWSVIKKTIIQELNKEEVKYIKLLSSHVRTGKGYNATDGGGQAAAKNPEVARKISEAKRGSKIPDIFNKRRSDRMNGAGNHFFGKKHSDRAKKMISEKNSGENSAWLGKNHTEQTKSKISKALSGRTLSVSTRKKISQKNKGRAHIVSDETREKMSKAQSGERHHMYGKSHSEKTKKKMSKARKGKCRVLNKSQIVSIVEEYGSKNITQKALAEKYNVSVSTIQRLLKINKCLKE